MERVTKLLIFIIIIFLLSPSVFAGEVVFFYHTDPAGTPLAMTDSSGTVVWRGEYKPFGEEIEITPEPENKLKFVGKEKDKETGLLYFGARYMEAKIGRFLSTDPVGPVDPKTGKVNTKNLLNPQRLNYYAYGLNNPYRYIDHDGRWPEEVHNRIIQVAFSEGKYRLPPHLRQAMEMGSVHVDKDQSKEGSYKHAMRAPGQTSQEAERLMNSFIEQKIKEYKDLMSQGRTGEAYFRLGEAMHPIMDSTSPSHRGFQEWNDPLSSPRHLWNAYEHQSRETVDVFNSNSRFMNRSVDSIRRLYDRANQ